MISKSHNLTVLSFDKEINFSKEASKLIEIIFCWCPYSLWIISKVLKLSMDILSSWENAQQM